MSERRRLIVGAAIMVVLAWLIASTGVDVVTNQREYLTALFAPNSTVAQVIGWWLAISTVALVLIVARAATNPNERFKHASDRFSVHATIPGYFFVGILPAGAGLVLMVLTGMATWGCWLACLSVPATVGFLWIALRAKVTRSGRDFNE